MTAEPTWCGIGKIIREEITKKENRDKYSVDARIQAYSLDRLIQISKVIIPALENGVNVIQARGVASTLCYQLQEAIDKNLSSEEIKTKILNQEGNKLQLGEYSPDLLIIPTINNPEELMRRLEERAKHSKEDNSMYENLKFQAKIKPLYESEWLKDLFEKSGTIVKYLDAGKTEADTRRQAVDIYKEFLQSKK
jgi:thymidylate kinase